MSNYLEAEGTWRAKLVAKEIYKAPPKEGETAEREYLKVGLEVTQGEHAGKTVSDSWYFTDAAYDLTVKRMRAFGWKGVDLGDLSTLGCEEADIVCQNDTFKGKTRLKVKFVNALGDSPDRVSAPLNAGELKSFAARMRAKIVGLDAKQAKAQPAKSAQPQREEPPPPIDADIPF